MTQAVSVRAERQHEKLLKQDVARADRGCFTQKHCDESEAAGAFHSCGLKQETSANPNNPTAEMNM